MSTSVKTSFLEGSTKKLEELMESKVLFFIYFFTSYSLFYLSIIIFQDKEVESLKKELADLNERFKDFKACLSSLQRSLP